MNPPRPPAMVPDLSTRLGDDAFLLGSWLTILDSTVPELMAGAGFDLLVADGEHGAVATSNLVEMLIAIRAAGVPLLFRVAANEPVRIMHALDAGAAGVVVPQIRTVADAERAVAWCRYPPVGLRGIAPRRASDYGRATADYMRTANERVVCCIQIETSEAMADLDAILAVPGIDTILIGPNDLSAALGHIGDLAHGDVEAAIATVLDRATARGIPAGVWTGSIAQARARREQGFRWATLGTDYGFMASAADAAAREVRAP
ncbi:MAG: aldolase/citrate lyase family protein [Chloroflexota bacterium]